jgi:methyl-accepting chemotaxis protein
MSQTAALRVPESDDPEPVQLSQNSHADIGERGGRLGVEIADMAGIVGDLTRLGREQSEQASSAIHAAHQMSVTNAELASKMDEASNSAAATRVTLSEATASVSGALARTLEGITTLGEGALGLKTSIGEIAGTIKFVQDTSDAIQQIARETQMLAINANVEAARAGDAGKGFAIIADSMKSLADKIRSFTGQNQKNLEELTRTLGNLLTQSDGNAEVAQKAISDSQSARDAAGTLQTLVASAQQLTEDIESMAQSVESNSSCYEVVQKELGGLADTVKACDVNLGQAQKRVDSILGISEDFILFIAESGIETPDTPIVQIAKETAQRIGAIFEQAVASGQIGMNDLFDENYKPVPRTNPQQHMTKFVNFTDRVLTPLQEPILDMNPRITFCAGIDRNGFLPTHNKKYSHPQGDDPVWNSANCRNRRIFNDRTGLSAGRSTRAFLLQTYRRDMGGGQFVLMKDVSAPVYVRGRHWGGFRIGFKV